MMQTVIAWVNQLGGLEMIIVAVIGISCLIGLGNLLIEMLWDLGRIAYRTVKYVRGHRDN